ncbi:MAG: siderophore-interacting protein [Haloechinothrix sp.]
MADRQRAKTKSLTRLRVLRTERLTPHMIRVVAGGAGLATFVGNEFTDAYVKVLFPTPGVAYPEPFDLQRIRAEYPREHWPPIRSYTVRYHDEKAGELAIDFVYHGNEGLAGPWAARAQPGDELLLLGPGGAYAPSDEPDWHLLVGDESALPAIAASLEAMPAGVLVHVFVEIEDGSEEQPLATKGNAHVRWLHRTAGENIVETVRALDFPEGSAQAFVHGEAGFVRALRRHLLEERGVNKDLLSISGYWRRGKTDEDWRAEKAAEKAAENAAERG